MWSFLSRAARSSTPRNRADCARPPPVAPVAESTAAQVGFRPPASLAARRNSPASLPEKTRSPRPPAPHPPRPNRLEFQALRPLPPLTCAPVLLSLCPQNLHSLLADCCAPAAYQCMTDAAALVDRWETPALSCPWTPKYLAHAWNVFSFSRASSRACC